MSDNQPAPAIVDTTPSLDSVIAAPVTESAPSVQNLGNVITNPNARRIVYGAYVIALLVLGAVAVYYVAVGQKLPIQLIGITAVFSFLGIPFGSLALSNTPKK